MLTVVTGVVLAPPLEGGSGGHGFPKGAGHHKNFVGRIVWVDLNWPL